MSQEPTEDQQFEETLVLLKKVWVILLVALYAACYYNEQKFPGFRETPLPGEEVLWKIQRVLFFGLLGVGLLTDIVQIRLDRRKAFLFLFASLVLGGLSTVVGSLHSRVVHFIFG